MRWYCCFLLMASVTLVGCSSAPVAPKIVPAKGTVTINGVAVNNARVNFVPLVEGLVGYKASGLTNAEGEFTLEVRGKGAGCCACECKVVVVEGPNLGLEKFDNPNSDAALDAALKFKTSLKNRPIPKKYQLFSKTPFSFTVNEEGENVFDLELKR